MMVRLCALVAILLWMFSSNSVAQVPQIITYQGRISAANTNFTGAGLFKFALGDGATARYWNSDGSPTSGDPVNAVALPISNGLFIARLGDTSLANMAPLPASVFLNSDVRVRMWFSDGNGFEQLSPDQRITAVGYAMTAANVPDGAITSSKIADGAITGAKIAAGTITTSNLAGGSLVPSGAVLLSDTRVNPNLAAAGYNLLSQTTVGDVWTAKRAVNPTTQRNNPSGIWTGQELILWGGWDYDGFQNLIYGDGARYELATDTWRAVTNSGAPSARYGHSAVWTGNEMIIWGGYNNSIPLNNGARYNPASNTWTAISFVNAPTARFNHSAIWTGTEMIIWGGASNSTAQFTGARYNPVSNTWTETSTNGAPSRRSGHLAFWTGAEMIVWGGPTNNGARYNPINNSWSPIASNGAPAPRPVAFTGVWSGTEMIVWGGYTNTGGRYNLASNAWFNVSTVGAPSPRGENLAVWTGTEMMIWGGRTPAIGDITLNDGGRYNPASNTWTPTPTLGAPAPRSFPVGFWTGYEVLISAGNTYDSGYSTPYEDTWTYVPGRLAYLYLKP